MSFLSSLSTSTHLFYSREEVVEQGPSFIRVYIYILFKEAHYRMPAISLALRDYLFFICTDCNGINFPSVFIF